MTAPDLAHVEQMAEYMRKAEDRPYGSAEAWAIERVRVAMDHADDPDTLRTVAEVLAALDQVHAERLAGREAIA